MRLVLELAVIAALIAFGWNKPFSERVGFAATPAGATRESTAAAERGDTVSRPAASAAPARTDSWMWDQNRKGSLDRPSPRPNRN